MMALGLHFGAMKRMSVVLSERTYTCRELVLAARPDRTTERLVLSWVGRGLLGRPHRPGRGRGRGRAALWGESQLRLFSALLSQRRRGAPLAALANIPVFLWLLGVPGIEVAQVRRALRTWLLAETRTPSGRNQAAARRTVEVLEEAGVRPTASARKGLIDLLATSSHTGRFDRMRTLGAIQRFLDPRLKGRQLGPADASLSTDTFVFLLEARFRAIRELGTLSDGAFERARLVYLATRGTYAGRQPEFAADAEMGHIYERPDENDLGRSACSDLITVLGLELLRPGAVPFEPAPPPEEALARIARP